MTSPSDPVADSIHATPQGGSIGRALGTLFLLAWGTWHALRVGLRRALSPAVSAPPSAEVTPPASPPDGLAALVVSPYSLHPMNHGGAVRIGNLVRCLQPTFDVDLFVFTGGTDDPTQRSPLEALCRQVFFQRIETTGARDPWSLRPPRAAELWSPRVAERLAALVDAHRIDVVFLEYAELGTYRNVFPRAKVVLVEHDLAFRTQRRQRALGFADRYRKYALGRVWTDWLRMLRHEVRACRGVDRVHTMSRHDARALAPHLGPAARAIRVVPNGVDTAGFAPREEAPPRRGLLFLGSFPHLPNRDALDFFVDDIWPLIQRQAPTATLTVAGTSPPPAVEALSGRDDIEVVGEVADVRPLYQSHRALVVPLRAGSGTRLKILEALASGLPVVSTRIGAEGIAEHAEGPIQIADDAQDFAAVVVELLADDGRADRLATEGLALAARRYDWHAIADTMARDLGALIAPDRRPTDLVDRASEADDSTRPAVSVVVHAGTDERALARCLDALETQALAGSVEVVVVATRPARGATGRTVVWVTVAAGTSVGLAFDAGCRAARGAILVVTEADATATDSHWLARLTAPFDQPSPPSVVQGGVHARAAEGAPPHVPWAEAPARAWRADHGGVIVSWTNLALPRTVWVDHPFGDLPALGAWSWQRRVHQGGHLVLPIWDAEVFHTRAPRLRPLLVEGFQDGRAQRRLGLRYGLGAAVRDLLQPPAFAGQGRGWLLRRSVRSHTERWFPWLRPLAVFVGHCVGRGG